MNIFERIVKCSVASEYETIMTQFLADFPWSIARLFSVSDSGNDVLHENGKAYKQKARNTICVDCEHVNSFLYSLNGFRRLVG